MRTVERSDERIFSADNFERDAKQRRADLGTHHEAARDIPVCRDCQMRVVGGGPSDTAAAVAAARSGADMVLLERCNHLGGLCTSGLARHLARNCRLSGVRRSAPIGPDWQQVEQCGGGAGFHPGRQSARVAPGGAARHCQRRIKPLARRTGGAHQPTIPTWPDLCPASARPTSRR